MKTLRQASCQCGICDDRKHFPRLSLAAPRRHTPKPDAWDRIAKVIVILAFVYLGLVAAWTWPVVAIVLGIVLTTSVLLLLVDR